MVRRVNKRDIIVIALVVLGVLDTAASVYQGREFHLIEKVALVLFQALLGK